VTELSFLPIAKSDQEWAGKAVCTVLGRSALQVADEYEAAAALLRRWAR
jgi:hypothetical protein